MNEKLLGYLDMNYSTNEAMNTTENKTLYLLNKATFDPENFNSIVENSTNGLQLTAIKDLGPNEKLICWFSDSYLNNIKSKNSFFFTIFIKETFLHQTFLF